MMVFYYDPCGWYQASPIPERATDVAPPSDTETTTPGELRANWSGYAWVMVPYFAPPEVFTPVPVSVTRRQARQALILAGLIDRVQPAIDGIADPLKRALAQSWWDDSNEFERDNAILATMSAAIGVTTPEKMDDIFRFAKSL